MVLKTVLLIASALAVFVVTAGSYLELFIVDNTNTGIFTVSLLILIWLVRKIKVMMHPEYQKQVQELKALKKERKELLALRKDCDQQVERLLNERRALSSARKNVQNTYANNYDYSSYTHSPVHEKNSSSSTGCLVALLALIYAPFRIIFTLMSGFMKKK